MSVRVCGPKSVASSGGLGGVAESRWGKWEMESGFSGEQRRKLNASGLPRPSGADPAELEAVMMLRFPDSLVTCSERPGARRFCPCALGMRSGTDREPWSGLSAVSWGCRGAGTERIKGCPETGRSFPSLQPSARLCSFSEPEAAGG